MRIAGVDDAGRGPIIGPLAIAGVLLEEEDLPKLAVLGVRDSKVLSPRKRERLAEEIGALALKFHVIMIPPAEIDRVVETGRKLHKLNRLEAQTMAQLITALKPDVAYVDASDVLADRFKNHIEENLSFRVKIISEHRADAKYPIVSAASILAKVERDKAISKLREKYGDLGSGYVTDPKTIKFLENWIKNSGSYPDFVRKSWKPAKKLRERAGSKQVGLV
ncbi:MAG: ribonuclease HII [Candidatus Bathyarchaeia archaeon]